MIMPKAGSALVLIVDDETPIDAVARDIEPVLAAWSNGPRPEVRFTRCAEAGSAMEQLPAGSVCWFRAQHAASEQVYALLDEIQQRHVPVVMDESVRDGVRVTPDEGVYCLPSNADTDGRRMVVESLWSQASVVASLVSEKRVLETMHGGLEREVSHLDEEMRLAAQLQREFLPSHMPNIDGLGFAAFWQPAGYVSGDIYDIQRLDEEHVGVFLADAVGHGVSAALMSMFIKRSLVTKQVDPSLACGYRLVEPADALAMMNADLVEMQTTNTRFCTAVYAIVHTPSRTVRLARAGHPPALWLRHGGVTEAVEPEGSLLGVFEDETFEQAEFQLAPGDRLLFHTDGFEMAFHAKQHGVGIAAPDAGRRVANTDYLGEFEAFRNTDIHATIDTIRERVNASAGSIAQRDDLTIVCVAADEMR